MSSRNHLLRGCGEGLPLARPLLPPCQCTGTAVLRAGCGNVARRRAAQPSDPLHLVHAPPSWPLTAAMQDFRPQCISACAAVKCTVSTTCIVNPVSCASGEVHKQDRQRADRPRLAGLRPTPCAPITLPCCAHTGPSPCRHALHTLQAGQARCVPTHCANSKCCKYKYCDVTAVRRPAGPRWGEGGIGRQAAEPPPSPVAGGLPGTRLTRLPTSRPPCSLQASVPRCLNPCVVKPYAPGFACFPDPFPTGVSVGPTQGQTACGNTGCLTNHPTHAPTCALCCAPAAPCAPASGTPAWPVAAPAPSRGWPRTKCSLVTPRCRLFGCLPAPLPPACRAPAAPASASACCCASGAPPGRSACCRSGWATGPWLAGELPCFTKCRAPGCMLSNMVLKSSAGPGASHTFTAPLQPRPLASPAAACHARRMARRCA